MSDGLSPTYISLCCVLQAATQVPWSIVQTATGHTNDSIANMRNAEATGKANLRGVVLTHPVSQPFHDTGLSQMRTSIPTPEQHKMPFPEGDILEQVSHELQALSSPGFRQLTRPPSP